MFGSLFAAAAAADKGKPDPDADKPWCRDGDATERFGVYRREGAHDGYLLALGDAGRTASVFPAFAIPPAPSGNMTVALTDVDGGSATFPSFDGLPRPDQVMKLVTTTPPIARSSGGGGAINITVNGSAIR